MNHEKSNKSIVVTELSTDVEFPYSCLSSSPDGRLVILGGQDTVRIVSVKPSGLKEVRSIRISHYFQANKSAGKQGGTGGGGSGRNIYFENVRDLFSNANTQSTSSSIVTVSDVAWSICQTLNEKESMSLRSSAADSKISTDGSTRDPKGGGGGVGGGGDVQDYVSSHLNSKNDPFGAIFSMPGDLRMADDSLIAAAGSNGVVLIWRACDLLRGLSDTNRNKQDIYKQFYGHDRFGSMPSDSASSSIGYPEAVLVEHTKAVKVAWHPNVPNQLLTASLDGTTKLWERSEDVDPHAEEKRLEGKKWSWLGALSTSQFDNTPERSFSWKCKQVFKPNCGGIREIKWSSFSDDLFAMVTNNGFLVVYYTIVPHRPTVRIAAHAREATTVDW
jgi:WD40 repeat protein